MIFPIRLAIALAMVTAAAPAQADTAVLAGGCFWGMESVFEHVKGVRDVVSGFAGGSARDANYDAVSSESTGHAEAVKITYDPKQISYGQLLQIFFTVAHDPTQVNRQGPDTGPSYRSAIFPQTASQRQAALAFIIESGGFYPAEAYHQDFARRHPLYPYILINDRPKVSALKTRYPNLFKA